MNFPIKAHSRKRTDMSYTTVEILYTTLGFGVMDRVTSSSLVSAYIYIYISCRRWRMIAMGDVYQNSKAVNVVLNAIMKYIRADDLSGRVCYYCQSHENGLHISGAFTMAAK